MTVDDHEAFRRSAGEVVEATPGFALVGEAASGEEALALAAMLSPDLILVDVRMPGLDGFETTRRLRSAHPAMTVILISTGEIDESASDSCGAAAFVPKPSGAQRYGGSGTSTARRPAASASPTGSPEMRPWQR